MTSIFKSNSKNSSKASSSESINQLDKELSASIDTLNIEVTKNDLTSILRGNKEDTFFQNYTQTNKHPLGKILITLADKFNKLGSSSKVKETPINLLDLCQSFNENISIEKRFLDSSLEHTTKTVCDDLVKKELSYHMIAPRVKAPSNFSSQPTLTDITKIVNCSRLFPKERAKFRGTSTGPDIAEFLFAINAAQDILGLSQTEFLDRLVASCTGEAHLFVRNLVDEGDSVDAIYYKLLLLFDHSPTPEEARNILHNYKVPKTDNLVKAQGFILEHAGLIAKVCVNEENRKFLSNFEAVNALLRSLPSKASAEVNTANQVLTQKYGHPPSFIQLIAYLDPLRQAIDRDIKENGVGFNRDNFSYGSGRRYNPPSSYRVSTFSNSASPRESYKQSSLQTRDTYSFLPRRTNSSNRSLRVNSITAPEPRNQFMNRLYCQLCGKSGSHNPAMGCYAMKLNGRTVANVVPSQDPCKRCEEHSGRKLFHPPKFCFLNQSNKTYHQD